jgi:carbamate kinase
MAKRVSPTELVWLITEALREEQGPAFATSLAVVRDKKMGWRTVIASPSRRRVSRKLSQKMAEVEERLRREYLLA